jgi:uncharacterized protein YdhG (YjbR/CyaY superfamily)
MSSGMGPDGWKIVGDYHFLMRKPRSNRGVNSAKQSSVPKTVDEYLVAVPEPARSTLNKVRAAIQSVVPADTTEVISYGIPAFRYKRILMWYAAFSDHCSVFPTASVIEKLQEELKPFRTSKGTIHFPIDKAPRSALVKKMVKMRLAEVEDKKGR